MGLAKWSAVLALLLFATTFPPAAVQSAETDLKWLQRLAEQGDAEAWYRIGVIKEQGIGMLADPAGAVKAFTKAAELGHAKAQFRLAQLLAAGTSGMLDLGGARRWYGEAAKQGITVLGNQAWDGKQPNYTALFTSIQAAKPDMIYLGGIYDNNGGQLIKDKVKVIVNRVGLDSHIGLKKAQETIGRDIYWQIPNDYRTMVEVRNNGVPLMEHAPKAAITQAIIQLAEALNGDREAQQDPKDLSTRARAVEKLLSLWPARKAGAEK